MGIEVLNELIDPRYGVFDTPEDSQSNSFPDISVLGSACLDDYRWKSHCGDFSLTPVAV